MDKFFTNIGKKIMTVSKIFFILLTVGGIIAGICIIFADFGDPECLFGGLGVAVASPLVAYLSTMPLYGFGKLVDSVEKIENKMAVNGDDAASVIGSNELPEL